MDQEQVRSNDLVIETKDLSKRYEDGLLALDSLNIKVKRGECFCLLGANGAGKTTALNLLLNFIEPTSGEAFINGYNVAREPLKAKKYTAFVSENVMLYDNLTARKNLQFFSYLDKEGELSRHQCYDILRMVGLEEQAFEQKVKNFSKGMRQKVGIAIAIAKNASAILLDEPNAGLDPKAAAELMAVLEIQIKNGKAIFMSTHDVFRAREIATRVGIMKSGKLLVEMERSEFQGADLQKIYLDYMG